MTCSGVRRVRYNERSRDMIHMISAPTNSASMHQPSWPKRKLRTYFRRLGRLFRKMKKMNYFENDKPDYT